MNPFESSCKVFVYARELCESGPAVSGQGTEYSDERVAFVGIGSEREAKDVGPHPIDKGTPSEPTHLSEEQCESEPSKQ